MWYANRPYLGLARSSWLHHGTALFHAGDRTDTGTESELLEALRLFGRLPHLHKVFVAGNHDRLFESDPETATALVPKSDLLH